MTSSPKKLRAIKTLHSLFWAFFAGCVFAIPIFAAMGRFDFGWWASGFMFVELVALALNNGHCPLTAIAARYTDDRRANFDIYLPLWLARYNKQIFGPLLLLGELYFVVLWAGWI